MQKQRPCDKELVERVSVWSNALRSLNHFAVHFSDEVSCGASNDERKARDVILDILENIKVIMTIQYRDALTAQIIAWDKEQEAEK